METELKVVETENLEEFRVKNQLFFRVSLAIKLRHSNSGVTIESFINTATEKSRDRFRQQKIEKLTQSTVPED
uniref:Uncharacterized protein n=1 Tax=Onchocerca volvulus TaxID=6282 RepID=A0A8R1XVP6_ONCVO